MSFVPDDLIAYQADRVRVQEKCNKIGRGWGSQASYALEVSATTISRVVRGIEINPPLLERIEEWATARLAATQSAVLAAS